MVKRLLLILAALMLAASIAGCEMQAEVSRAPNDAVASPSTTDLDFAIVTETTHAPSTTPEASPEPETVPAPTPVAKTHDFAIENAALAPWQTAYIELLEQICAEEAPKYNIGDDEPIPLLSDSYGLYDIDEDGVPELFIKYGDNVAAHYADVYTYRDNAVAVIGQFGLGHVNLYSWPGEDAVVLNWAQGGDHVIYKAVYRNGEIVQEEDVLFLEERSETRENGYTPVEDIVPGSERIDMSRTTLFLPANTPLTLPIYEYGHGAYPTGDATQEAREAITDVLYGTRRLYGVSGDGFGGDVGWMTFEEYCKPEVLVSYARYSMIPCSLVWLDMNGDGQEECVVNLEEDEQADYPTRLTVIFSYQDEVVYAYLLFYVYDYSLGKDGMLYSNYNSWATRFYFYKNQCYFAEFKADGDIEPVEWEYID